MEVVTMKKPPRVIVFIIASVLLCSALNAADRNPRWAEPVAMRGVPNLHRVTDDLYRGAQPTREGFRNLEAMGIRTVINLRSFHGDDTRGTSLKYFRVGMKAWEPEADELIRALRILSDPGGAPYFVHCQHGADRTGMVTAVYRMVFQSWSKDEAIEEMTEGGYGFHPIWREIPEFLRGLDIEKIKRAL
jgi:protein tyrosine/serine phosphatase